VCFLNKRNPLAITKYGYDVVLVVVLVVLAGSFLSWQFIEGKPLRFGLIGVLLALLVFTLNFFRDPERAVPQNDGYILAPADGKVVLVREVVEDEYLNGEAIQVSIFMSPLNVHVNRYPISGTVGYFKYFPGEYLVAYEEKASLRNERTHIGIENGRCKILFKQIAGFVARRIVAPVKVGDEARAGERFGMIRFGSRVDVIMPKSVALKVRVGDKTVAGETVLAVIV
jgi:phosphatidylserine decarboxylase